jgi:hypothetical protein
MRIIKNTSVILLIFVLFGLSVYLKPSTPIVITYIILFAGFLILNLSLKNKLSFKNYFISKYNLFTTKSRSEKFYDIPNKLMFDKILEVLNESNFKIVGTDIDNLGILARTKLSAQSWGENLYFSFEKKDNGTIMKLCSVTLFQWYAWGKNESNCDLVLIDIENSLII